MALRVQRETGVRLNLLDIAGGTLATLAMQLPMPGEAPAEAAKNPPVGNRLRRLLGLR